ncbi:MAG: hypothetical protein J0H15_12790 [Xanthomonadales bacterium]|nr:hypothetical protein [Xanthomonadales bacterium]
MSTPMIVQAVRTLTVAVWALVAVTALSLLVPPLWGLFWPASSDWPLDLGEGRPAVRSMRIAATVDPLADFHDWPIKRQIASASAILRVDHHREDNRWVSRVGEILKLQPGTELHYTVGDVYERVRVEPRSDPGEGMVVFFTGSPAFMRVARRASTTAG